MRKGIFIFLIIFLCAVLNGQINNENITGKVSFITSQNIYVKFNSTEGISIGDTLYISAEGKILPALKVNNLSSTSCVCTIISSTALSVNDQVIVKMKQAGNSPSKVVNNAVKEMKVQQDTTASEGEKPVESKTTQKIRGSLSAYSYADFSNSSAHNSTQFRYTFTLDARNIGNSKFSVDNYMSFRHKPGNWSEVKSNVFNALKIYSLNVRYDLNKSTQISLGRKINQKISSIGAMDGLQFEKSFNKFSMGALVGSRPDFTDYGFDSKLFQYGAYVAYSSVTAANYLESSLAFMQQTNNGKTDRRFLYFQHSNSLIKNIYFFSTFEADLYKLKNDTANNYTPQNTFNLTGLYLSLRYKMTKNFTLSGSYDGRKNVIYYETFKSFIDQLIEKEMRQSFRLQADYSITSNLMFGLQGGYRYLKSDPHPSVNANGYLTYSQIPGLNMSVTINGAYLESNYLNSKIFGASLSRDFFKGRFYTSIGYRYVDYKYPEGLIKTTQNMGELNLFWQLSKNMSLSANYEGTFEKKDKYSRIYFQIRKRF